MYFGWCLRGSVCNSQPEWCSRFRVSISAPDILFTVATPTRIYGKYRQVSSAPVLGMGD